MSPAVSTAARRAVSIAGHLQTSGTRARMATPSASPVIAEHQCRWPRSDVLLAAPRDWASQLCKLLSQPRSSHAAACTPPSSAALSVQREALPSPHNQVTPLGGIPRHRLALPQGLGLPRAGPPGVGRAQQQLPPLQLRGVVLRARAQTTTDVGPNQNGEGEGSGVWQKQRPRGRGRAARGRPSLCSSGGQSWRAPSRCPGPQSRAWSARSRCSRAA